MTRISFDLVVEILAARGVAARHQGLVSTHAVLEVAAGGLDGDDHGRAVDDRLDVLLPVAADPQADRVRVLEAVLATGLAYHGGGSASLTT